LEVSISKSALPTTKEGLSAPGKARAFIDKCYSGQENHRLTKIVEFGCTNPTST
jgi:hypothetical protein